MKIKGALKFIFHNARKIDELSEKGCVCAINLLNIYNEYIKSEEKDIYVLSLCLLTDEIEYMIKEKIL